MRSNFLKTFLKKTALVSAGVLLTASVTLAADIYLKTQSFNKELTDSGGDPVPVPMWGFALCTDDTFTGCGPATAPGPKINALSSDSLTIHLNNTLDVPVSILIPGQDGEGNPTFFTDASGRLRVRSLTAEVTAGGTRSYTWSTLKAGTYLYQSGTNSSLQVPMGLYGALIVDGGLNESVLLLSEIDPVQNQHAVEELLSRVSDGLTGDALIPTQTCEKLADYQPGIPDNYPCVVDYNPTYFLVNGEQSPALNVSDGTAAQEVLLRFLNAGLKSHTPSIVGVEMNLVAEDGNPVPGAVRRQSEVLLAAGKTMDVLVTVDGSGDNSNPLNASFPVFDRMSRVNGRMAAKLDTGAGVDLPANLAMDDSYSTDEDTALPVAAASGVLSNDDPSLGNATAVIGTSHGTLVLNAVDGSFTYTPDPDYSGFDGFIYSASAGPNTYYAGVIIEVSFTNDAPVAAADGIYSNNVGLVIKADAAHGVLGNDSDPDGDMLQAVLDGGPIAGLTLNSDGSFEYSGGSPLVFSYFASDGLLMSDSDPVAAGDQPVTVTLDVKPVANIALTVEDPLGTAIADYRWIVQEDVMFHPDPTASLPSILEQRVEFFNATQSLNFHKSYMPVIAQGCVAAVESDCGDVEMAVFNDAVLDPAKHYYVSVLPLDAGKGDGHTIGGAQILPGATFVTVVVNNQPIPTAQVSVHVFNDNFPTNGVPDAPEPGLGGFEIVLEDAGGRYGISGGPMMQDAFGNPLKNYLDCFGGAEPPMGVIMTCPDTPGNLAAGLVGQALVKNLPPAKYGVIALAPPSLTHWVQTSTIEGTKVIDAWVKANEPPYFLEFGGQGPHAFLGFVDPDAGLSEAESGDYSISGSVTLFHDPRPPAPLGSVDSNSYEGLGHTRAWIGLNSVAGDGPNIRTVHANPDGTFTLSGIPDGTHQIVVWDDYLDQIIAFRIVDVAGGDVDLGNVPVNHWFTRAEHNVFLDANNNGVFDAGEIPLAEQAVNLRWRDGTVNQSFPTDTEGFVPFDEVFPFFSWQAFEVDYTRFKPTGVTVTVDAGGDVNAAGSYQHLLNPQKQLDGSFSRTELGSTVLIEGFQGFPGQTSVFEWGKVPYQPGENGGISGIVFYSSTRGENDPRLTVGDPWEPGIPGVKVRLYREVARANGKTGLVLVEETETDSWDNALPKGCPGEDVTTAFVQETLGSANLTKCYDGMRNWNQVRPGVFDGGYAFNDIPAGIYVVEVVPPPGYELYKEENVNVGFGDSFAPNAVMMGPALIEVVPDPATIEAMNIVPGIAQPRCVGPEREVGPFLSLFPSLEEPAPFAGVLRPLCSHKEVILSDQGQAAADFHLLTSTPVAGQYTGLVLDDLTNSIDPRSPSFGEKWGPSNLPFAIRDYTGRQVYRGYGDPFGRYNGMLPSTFTANMPIPSGYSPAMMLACMNDPGDGPVPDPFYLNSYGTACYTLQFMPGTTTYLDTPILPQAAFAGGYNPVDCEFPDGTPVIASVSNKNGANDYGPWIRRTGPSGSTTTLTITSAGDVLVANPAYEGPFAQNMELPTVSRDFGFGGSMGTVKIGDRSLAINSWSPNTISVEVPSSVNLRGELTVTRGDNSVSSLNAVTVTVSNGPAIRVAKTGPADFRTVQEAIDAAQNGQLILVAPGVYEEQVVMWKPVRLQGYGAATVINATQRLGQSLEDWNTRIADLLAGGAFDPLPGQVPDFATERAAGITVLAQANGSFGSYPSSIDGFTITGASSGGGIFINGYAHNLEVSNNKVTGNSGVLHGGIRAGHPNLPGLVLEGASFGFNNNLKIHHNAITLNGASGEQSAGGGISICTGTDNYSVSHNFICGNYASGNGAGIGHYGLSDNGLIEFNEILFNQSFDPTLNPSGGGIFLGGEAAGPPDLTLGAGNVVIDANRIQGNHAAAGHGGGIRTEFFNGADADAGSPWLLSVTNNTIVNNVAGYSGGGISLQDTVNSEIVNNTVANNDSTATVGGLVIGNTSEPQPAGISSGQHSLALADAVGAGFSNPDLFNNIIWHNRAFSYGTVPLSDPPRLALLPDLAPATLGSCSAGANYWDLCVLGGGNLNPRFSLLSDTTGYHSSNITGAPDFLNGYCNGARELSTPWGPMRATAALGEGGNLLDVRYGPLTQIWPENNLLGAWDYHVMEGSAARDTGDNANASDHDFDDEPRPMGGTVDIGADEWFVVTPPPGTVAFTSATLGTLSGGTLDFGNRSGLVSSTITITVGGGTPVTFGALSVGNTSPAAFSMGADGCSGQTRSPGGSCTVTVNFNGPSGNNLRQGTLNVPHNGAGNSSTLNLAGR